MSLSPAGWLDSLERRLTLRWTGGMAVYDAYYEGDHRLTFATQKFREAFGSLFGPLADNWMKIVVDASAERLAVQGFRFGDSQAADDDAWDIWQANNLDAESDMLHTEAIKLGEAYWLVEPPQVTDDPPLITAEHASQMIVACAPGNHRKCVAALKKWQGEDGYAYATLYLPNQIYKFVSQQKLSSLSGTRINWMLRRDDPGGPNPFGAEIPVVPICNTPTMLRGGTSELAGGPVRIQNAVNKLLCDMLITSEYMSFPMRVLIGVDQMVNAAGQPITAYEASQQRLLTFPSPDSKTAEFSSADLSNFSKAIEGLVHHLAAQTRTPPHYVLGEIVNASGDALKAAETGLVSKVRRKMRPFGEGHEQTMRLAFKAIGDDERAAQTNSETIWRDPETRSFAELVDGLVKLSTIGVPQVVLWEKAGFSPAEIDRMKSLQAEETLLQQIPASREALRFTETLGPDGQPIAPAAPPAAVAEVPPGKIAVPAHVRSMPTPKS